MATAQLVFCDELGRILAAAQLDHEIRNGKAKEIRAHVKASGRIDHYVYTTPDGHSSKTGLRDSAFGPFASDVFEGQVIKVTVKNSGKGDRP